MMKTPAKIDLTDINIVTLKKANDPSLFVFWVLGNQCTYSCSYCPERFHSGTFKYQPTEKIQKLLKTLPPADVMFSGGEATYHPDFEKIVLEKPDHIKLSVISNASRPIGFWERITEKLHCVILTFHSEFANLDRFLATANLVYKEHKRYGRVNLTMIPEKWDYCINVYNTLIENKIPVIAKPLVENFGSGSTGLLSGYTSEQLKWISEVSSEGEINDIMLLDKDNNVIHNTSAPELLSSHNTDFREWECHTNTSRMYVDMDGSIFDTVCKQRTQTGSIYTGYTLPTEPMICKQNFCWCHSDINAKKIKITPI